VSKLILGVPTLNRYDLLQRLLRSVEAGTCHPDVCLIVDNGGKLLEQLKVEDWTLKGLPKLGERIMIAKPAANGERGCNLGVAASWNSILKAFPDDLLILSGDDIVVEPDALEKMVAAAERSKGLFFVAKGASSFAFFLQKPELAKKIGFYDELFWPAYYEDNDYHRRMKLAGEDYELAEGAVVTHDISSTLSSLPPEEKKKFEEEIGKNSRYYGIKWGGPPGYERLTEPNPDAVNHR